MTDDTHDSTSPEFTVLGGNPTPGELAAVTAVLTAAIEEATTMGAHTAPAGRSAWQLAQRPIRRPIDRGISAWRGFSG
ncbi:acyl-CoA carboxylase epsilon subunit [Parafrigoribacterium humi]|uniref:acyl-CoA carboxylase epsilon subunit n=1 Tax=Parafrigoribacterium humi TaxID=3144664 RepID=UPI0032EBE469